MGIVAKAFRRLTLSLGCGVRAEGSLFARGTGDRGLCGAVASISGAGTGRHSRSERLIGNAVPVQASLSAGLRPSTITVGVSGKVMRCHRRMAVGCRSVARLRSAAWCHRNQDRWRSQQR